MFASAIVFFISLFNRVIYIDDAWFGEQAYQFLKLGYVNTPSIINFHGWDERLFVYHKLNIIIGAGLIYLFGWSPEPARMFTLIIYLVFLAIIFKILVRQDGVWTQINPTLVMFFLIVNPEVIIYAFTFRPEILTMSLGYYSFLLLLGRQSYSKIIFAGILAGTAVLVHLNGVMYVFAGFVLLLWKRDIKFAFIFGIFAALFTSFYFYDLLDPGNFSTFLYQIKHWPDNITTNYNSGSWYSFLIGVFIKLSHEHQRFFWSPDVWGLSAMVALALLASGRTLWRKYKELIIYFLVADVSLNIFGSHIAEVNMLLLLPFMALIAGAFLTELKVSSVTFVKSIAMVIVVFQIVIVLIGFIKIINSREDTTKLSKMTLSVFPNNDERILVPYRFIFNELPNKNLISYKTMEYHQVEHGSKFSKQEFLNLADRLNIHYLVITPEMYAENAGMYPWMPDEFKGMADKTQPVKLVIIDKTHTLKIIE